MVLIPSTNLANFHNHMHNISNVHWNLCTNGQIGPRTIVTGIITSTTYVQNGIPKNVQIFSQYPIQNSILSV